MTSCLRIEGKAGRYGPRRGSVASLTTLKEHARAATATLQSALQTAPNGTAADQTATIIKIWPIRKATRGHARTWPATDRGRRTSCSA